MLELKLYFYPSAGGFYQKLKNVSCEYDRVRIKKKTKTKQKHVGASMYSQYVPVCCTSMLLFIFTYRHFSCTETETRNSTCPFDFSD